MDNNISILQGKPVTYTPTRLPNGDVILDPNNPRVQFLVGQAGGTVTEEQLDEMLWSKDQVKALAGSIFQNGGIREPIIVQKLSDGRTVVREGNCRTVANRHLASQYPGDTRFSSIPVHLYERDLTEEDVAVLLADMHVAKKISWDAYEQAKVIYDLYTIHGKTYDWLSNHLRLSKGKVSEQLAAYKATSDFLAKYPSPENIGKFSFFQEIMKKKDLREKIDSSAEFRGRIYEWITRGKLADSKQIRGLSEVLEHPEALAALEANGYEAAQRVIITDDPARGSELFHAVRVATDALKIAPASEIRDLKEGNPQKIIMLKNLFRAVDDLATLAGIRL